MHFRLAIWHVLGAVNDPIHQRQFVASAGGRGHHVEGNAKTNRDGAFNTPQRRKDPCEAQTRLERDEQLLASRNKQRNRITWWGEK